MLVAIRTPVDNERGPRYMEKVLGAVQQAAEGREVIQLEFGSHAGELGLFLRFPRSLRTLILEPFAAKYPACRFAEVVTGIGDAPSGPVWYASLRLTPNLFPILRHAQFEDMLTRSFEDPIDAVLRSVQPQQRVEPRVAITIRPASRARCRHAKRIVKRLDAPFFSRHFELATLFARWAMRPCGSVLTWPLTVLACRGESRVSVRIRPAACPAADDGGGLRGAHSLQAGDVQNVPRPSWNARSRVW